MRQHIRIALEGVRQTLAAQGFTKTLAAMYRTDPLSAEIVFRDELFQMGREVLGDTFEIMDDFGPSVEVEEEKYPPFHREVRHLQVVGIVVKNFSMMGCDQGATTPSYGAGRLA